MKHFANGLIVLALMTGATQAQSACRPEPIETLLEKMAEKKFTPAVKFDIAMSETQTLPAIMIANSATGSWFILVKAGINLTCIPMAGFKLEPAK